MGGGSAQVNPPYQVSVAEGLARAARGAVDRRRRRRGRAPVRSRRATRLRPIPNREPGRPRSTCSRPTAPCWRAAPVRPPDHGRLRRRAARAGGAGRLPRPRRRLRGPSRSAASASDAGLSPRRASTTFELRAVAASATEMLAPPPVSSMLDWSTRPTSSRRRRARRSSPGEPAGRRGAVLRLVARPVPRPTGEVARRGRAAAARR